MRKSKALERALLAGRSLIGADPGDFTLERRQIAAVEVNFESLVNGLLGVTCLRPKTP